MFKNMKIRNRLILFTAVLLLIPALSIGIFGYIAAKKEVKDQIENSASEQVTLLNGLTDEFFKNKRDVVELFSKTLNSTAFENEVYLNERLGYISNSFQEVTLTYVGTKDGKMYSFPRADFPEDYNPAEREWYKEAAANKGEAIITSPYKDEATGKTVVTIASTLTDGSGVMAMDIDLAVLAKQTMDTKIGSKGYPSILDQNGKVVVHPTLKPGDMLDKSINEPIYKAEKGSFNYTFNGANKAMMFETSEQTGWKVLGTIDTAEFTEQSAPILLNTIIVILIFIVVGTIFNYFTIRSIVRPIRLLSVVAGKVSKGDLTEKVHVASKDDLGQLGVAFNTMIDSLKNLLSQIEHSSDTLSASSEQVQEHSRQVSGITKEIAQSVDELSDGAETQMVSTEETAKAVQEIATGVQYVAERAASVSHTVSEAAQQTQKGSVYIDKAVKQMDDIYHSVEETTRLVKELGDKSAEINKIVDVITGISEQTNLLALNAAIEAARAGEHGKGFAVVADEVRKLAEGSKQSAEQITTLIRSIQKRTDLVIDHMAKEKEQAAGGLDLIKETGDNFSMIQKAVQEVNSQIQEVSATAEQMSASSEEVTASVEEMASIATESASSTQQVAAGAQQQFSSMEEIGQSINKLAELAAGLKTEIAKFKTK
ncbi:methyl-accepting chemotaxis protein [Metabacillus sp. KIGAM252]|uniref:Methyl-accepting chemotaxis protein n=1 Tax=Metabacillus flavus TaxID=2823519 RepID=A0ABS5LJ87_9BACI|nr:methyl-accepting chemotaxis protein [Metabacillus flavus]MBS2970811.1 methyl-accepting chemotaxis protein [Metabacillus flavus]